MSPKSRFSPILPIITVCLLLGSCDQWSPNPQRNDQIEEAENLHCLTKRSKLPQAECIKRLDKLVTQGQVAAQELSPYLFWERKPDKRTLEVLRIHATGSVVAWWPLSYNLGRSCDLNDLREALILLDRMIASPEYFKETNNSREGREREREALFDIVKDLDAASIKQKSLDIRKLDPQLNPECIDFSANPSTPMTRQKGETEPDSVKR